jgi:hypothetical protein
MKKKIIILVIIILIVAGGGFFWWWKGREIKGSPADYIIKETGEGRVVENKKAGLTIKVPEGWEVKKMEVREGSVLIHTSDIEGKKWNEMVVPPLTKGCGVEVSVVYKKMNFDEIKEEVKTIHWGLRIKSEEFEKVTINNWQALKNTFESDVLGLVSSIYIPIKNKLYDFDLYWGIDEKEKCIQEFDKFLDTVSIK